MILDTTLKIEIILTAAKTTNDMNVTVDYKEWNNKGQETQPATVRTTSNGTTAATILAAPVQNPVREPLRIKVYNTDTATKTVRIRTNDGTTADIDIEYALPSLKSLIWEKEIGYYVTT